MSKLRNFVRLSDKNEFVIGTNTKGVRKPVKGRWYEIFEPNCCQAFAPVGDPEENTYTVVSVFCGEDLLAVYDVESVDLSDVANQLNLNYPGIGEWSSTALGLYLSSSVCPSLSISITYASSGSQATTTSTTTTSTTSTSTTSSSTSTTSTTGA